MKFVTNIETKIETPKPIKKINIRIPTEYSYFTNYKTQSRIKIKSYKIIDITRKEMLLPIEKDLKIEYRKMRPKRKPIMTKAEKMRVAFELDRNYSRMTLKPRDLDYEDTYLEPSSCGHITTEMEVYAKRIIFNENRFYER